VALQILKVVAWGVRSSMSMSGRSPFAKAVYKHITYWHFGMGEGKEKDQIAFITLPN
jgi:hypothetical protein